LPKHPFYKQRDSMDCGPTCLRMISSYFGRSYSMQLIRQKCDTSKEGVSLLGLSEAAESLGFHTSCVRIEYDQLKKEAPFPCIAHWKNSHFVVIYEIKKKRSLFKSLKESEMIKIADPAHGIISYTKKEFLNCWSTDKNKTKGICLIFETTPRFYNENPESKQSLDFRYLLNFIKPYRRLITQLLLASLTGSLISLAFPFLTQSIVDYGINNSNLAFITMVLVAQMVLSLGQTANGLIRSWIMLHMTTRIGISLISSFLAKLMKLPISFFDVKLIGDIIQRIGDHSRIQRLITGSLLTSLFSVITLIMYSFVMASYHMGILGIFYLGSTLYISWITLFLKRRRALD